MIKLGEPGDRGNYSNHPYRFDGPGFESYQEQEILIFSNTSRQIMASVYPPIQYLTGLRGPKRDVDHSPPFSAEFKNEWSYTSAPYICFYGVDRDKSI